MWAIENSWWEQSYEIFNKLKKLITHLCRAIKIEQVETSLHDAAAEGHLEICKLICENISSLDSRSDCGCLNCGLNCPCCNFERTPLHEAAINGHLEIYKIIAERVKEINPKDRNGKTPLRLAEEKFHHEICRLIRSLPPYVSIFQAYNQIKQRDAKLSNPEKKRRKKK